MGKNLYEYVKHSGVELVETLFEDKNMRIERIVSQGEASPDGFFYDQFEDEWVTLLSGNATVSIESVLHELKKGDSLFIPRRTKHRVEHTAKDEDTIWLCVFYK